MLKYKFLRESMSLTMTATLIAVNPASAVAQDASVPETSEGQDSAPDAEIVVTARQRAERLIDVPVAVTTVSNSNLERSRVNDLQQIATLIPSVIIGKTASSAGASLSIRGVGSTFTDSGVEQTVSVNVDGFQGARGYVTNIAFLDLARVEVLKGPQSLFFGKNSPAGVISLVSNNPTRDFFASAKAGYEFVANERYAEGIISGPLSPELGARLALRYSDMDGYFTNLAEPIANPFEPAFPLPGASSRRAPAAKSVTARGTLRWQSGADFTATFKGLYGSYKDDGLTKLFQPNWCAPGFTQPSTIGNPSSGRHVDPFGNCKADKFISTGDLPPALAMLVPGYGNGRLFSKVDSFIGTMDLQYVAGPLTFSSLTAYYDNKFGSLGSQDDTVFVRLAGGLQEKTTMWTEEFRIGSDFDGPVNGMLGGFYEDGSRSNAIVLYGTSVPVVDPSTGMRYNYEKDAFFSNRAWSLFGQLRWEFLPKWELAGGARYTNERRKTSQLNKYLVSNLFQGALMPQGVVVSNKFKDDNISPEATLTWHPMDDITLYGAYKTGYKSGGASVSNSLSITATPESLAFGPEKANGYELGLKGQAIDRKLTFSIVGYSYKYEGIQLSSATFREDIGAYFASIRNAATARTKGIEVEASLRPTPTLTLQGAAAYNHARFTSFPNALCYSGQTAVQGCNPISKTQDRSGAALARAPAWTLSGSINYDRLVTNSLALGASLSSRYMSSFLTQDDGLPQGRQKGFATVDATLRIHDRDDRWEVAMIGRNLTDRYYVLTTNARSGGLPGEIHGTVSRPREIAIQLSYKFGS